MMRLEMKNDINKKAAKMSALSSGKINKYDILQVKK